MIQYLEALARLRAAAPLLPEESVPLPAALGRVASRPVSGREPIPPFDNSSMDGFALAAAKAASAPARLPVLGTIYAGDRPRCQAEAGAWRIMTGAPIPAGCDAVVPVEKTRELDGGRTVELLEPAEPGDYVRAQGRDFEAGAEVCAAGTRLGARHLLALAAVGAASVPARRRPRVGLIPTGRELAPADAERLEPGQIRDASSAYLAAAIAALGAELEAGPPIADDPEDFKLRLGALLSRCDLVLSTGAVSMGAADFIPRAVRELGGEAVFHGVAIRPGKPALFARFPKGPLFFGLPGNPVSTVVGLRFFVEPLLRAMCGRAPERGESMLLSAGVPKPAGLRCFFKARRLGGGLVEILPGQASFQIHSLVKADCWAVLPEPGESLPAGTEVEVFPLSEELG